jgi:hypothetical protein
VKKPRGKANGNLSRTPDDRQIVQALRAKGLSGDVISEILKVNKNTLRSKHALALHIGRAKLKQQKAEASDLTRAQKHAADSILSAVNSHWQTPDHGNLIFSGLDGHGARSAAQAYAKWLLNGGHWNCSGLATNFSDAQVVEFVALKRAAEELLKDFPQHGRKQQ